MRELLIEESIASATESVILKGDGIAAACAGRLLIDAKMDCALIAAERPKLAAILLGEQTQRLLQEIFETNQNGAGLFSGFTRITKRIVLWGEAKIPVVLPHAGVVASEEELLKRLWQRVSNVRRAAQVNGSWVIASYRDACEESSALEWSYGTRMARFARVKLRDGAEENACWVESVQTGWLFMLFLGDGMASLICVGGTVSELLEGSRLIAPRIEFVVSESGQVASYPRMRQRLLDGRRIACGGAAMNFDPLCGEGAGNAAREAFLAAAVIRAAVAGEDVVSLEQHYASRLMHGFQRHLQLCLQIYSSGGMSEFWRAECESLRKGLGEFDQIIPSLPAARYRLADRKLIPLESAP